jgi:hypothetical protein
MNKRVLTVTFALILLSMIIVTGWASTVQPMWEWTGLKDHPNHAWTIATMFDTYFAFITFYIWVVYKERRGLPRILWFIAIMALGNMAIAGYMLKELRKVRSSSLSDQDAIRQLLITQNT